MGFFMSSGLLIFSFICQVCHTMWSPICLLLAQGLYNPNKCAVNMWLGLASLAAECLVMDVAGLCDQCQSI